MMNDPADNPVFRIPDGNLQFAHIGKPSSPQCRLKRLPCEIVEMCGVDHILPSFSLHTGPKGSRIRCREQEPSSRLKLIRKILKFLPRFAEVFKPVDSQAFSLALASASIPTARMPYSLATLHKAPTPQPKSSRLLPASGPNSASALSNVCRRICSGVFS